MMNRATGNRRTRLKMVLSVLGYSVVFSFALGILGVGCAGSEQGGYTADSLYQDDISTVAVPIFENGTLYTGIERDITDAIIKEIHARTPYRVRRSGNADTILTGKITGVEKTKVSQLRGSGLVQDTIVAVTVDFQWKDLRSGEIIVERLQLETGDVYVSAQPVGERPQVGLWAVSEELAQDIVGFMREAW